MTRIAIVDSGMSWAEKVALVGVQMKENLPSVDTPVRHIFEPGVYIREITIPAGVLFVGRAHRYGHKLRMLEGRCRLIGPDGSTVIEPPYEMATYPGFLMVLETYEHHVGRTYHPNPDECRDTDLMERLIFQSAKAMHQLGQSVQRKIRELT